MCGLAADGHEPLQLSWAGTLNGVIPHPALVKLFETAAGAAGTGLQRSAHVGALTDLSYVQVIGEGVAAIDLGFPCRYTHSALEVCAVSDLVGLCALLEVAIPMIGQGFRLERE